MAYHAGQSAARCSAVRDFPRFLSVPASAPWISCGGRSPLMKLISPSAALRPGVAPIRD